MSSDRKTAPSVKPRIVVIGAGVGGICFGVALKQQLGYEDFTIYEQSSDISGTWTDNTYPGCASDIPTHWYCLSTEMNANWSRSHVFQPEIKAYWQRVAEKHSLYSHIVLNTRVVAAEWQSDLQLYRVEVENVKTGERSVVEAQVVVSATGILSEPSFPPELDIKKFKGTLFHSARWRHDVDLKNKRVAVIGNACSAAQFVPIISQDLSTQVVNFCRSPTWFVKVNRPEYSETQKWIFNHIPLTLRLHRYQLMAKQEFLYLSIRNKRTREKFMETMAKQMKESAPERYHDKVIPTYPAGCKRIVVDTGYLSALHRPNLELNWDGIAEVTEDGVITKTGEHLTFDVMIFATGFTADDYAIPIKGKDGGTVRDYYQAHNGPTAYCGMTIPEFPNFYMIAGPNTSTGYGSVIFAEEVEINYMLKLIQPVIQGLASSFEVTPQATDAYNREIQSKLEYNLWSNCTSWYRTGPKHDGKIVRIFPGPMTYFWWRMRKPKFEDYVVVGGEKWIRRRRLLKAVRLSGFVLAALAVAGWVSRDEFEVGSTLGFGRVWSFLREHLW